MRNNLNKLTDKVKERVIKQIKPKVAEQIKTAFAELEKDWAIRERYIKEQTKKEILDKIVNYNQNKLRWLWNDGEIFIALSSIKQQLNQPKTEE